MNDTELKKIAWKTYKENEFTSNLIIAFSYAESRKDEAKIYVMEVDSHSRLIDESVKLDRESSANGGGKKIRFSPTKIVKYQMIEAGAFPIMTAEEFKKRFLDWRKETGKNYNQGEFFEKLVTEWNGEKWVKDSIPYTEAGDVVINGKSYQIKKEGAQFATLAQLEME